MCGRLASLALHDCPGVSDRGLMHASWRCLGPQRAMHAGPIRGRPSPPLPVLCPHSCALSTQPLSGWASRLCHLQCFDRVQWHLQAPLRQPPSPAPADRRAVHPITSAGLRGSAPVRRAAAGWGRGGAGKPCCTRRTSCLCAAALQAGLTPGEKLLARLACRRPCLPARLPRLPARTSAAAS